MNRACNDIPDAKTPGDLISVDRTWDIDGTLGIGVQEDGGRAIVVLDRAGVERLHAVLGTLLAQAEAGPYRLTEQDAAHMNAAVDMPDQPAYDWTDVAEDEEPESPPFPHGSVSDGFGSEWGKCLRAESCGLQVVRPGKVQCWCDDPNAEPPAPCWEWLEDPREPQERCPCGHFAAVHTGNDACRSCFDAQATPEDAKPAKASEVRDGTNS